MNDNDLRAFTRWALAYLDEPCRYDHHGYCQSHALDPAPCPVEQMRSLLDVDPPRT